MTTRPPAAAPGGDDVTHQLDSEYRIVRCNEAWDQLAAANDASRRSAEARRRQRWIEFDCQC